MTMWLSTVWLFVLAVCVQSATTHKHVHTINKERTEDGAFSPRDSHHLERGEHFSEFDLMRRSWVASRRRKNLTTFRQRNLNDALRYWLPR
uniref:Putative secreted protein n=1 Tax=Anopheles darlingi TaxID=43151 RepID=A0A2M4DP96_ANODA